jgi:hypothetical protein
MLEMLRHRVMKALSEETVATLSTKGPGGLQAGYFPCQADGLTLYLLIPASSDLLFNLESEKAVVVTTPRWQMEGDGEICPLAQAPSGIELACTPQAPGCVLVAAVCRRIHFNWLDGWGYRETIDL